MLSARRLSVANCPPILRPGVWMSSDGEVAVCRTQDVFPTDCDDLGWRLVALTPQSHFLIEDHQLWKQRFSTRRAALQVWSLLTAG